jgi:tRNA threonylcarbamoyl adenosine modification protein YeaZ
MIVLAVDTSSGQGSLALANDDAWCDVVELSPEWKSTTLHDEIARLLEQRGLHSRDVGGYAVANGPGAFTGLRVGLTAVKGLAEVHGKPVVPLSTLMILAASAREHLPASFSGVLAPALDARRGQVFATLFAVEEEAMRPLCEESVGSARSFLERVRVNAPAVVRFCATERELLVREIVAAGWSESFLLSVPPALAGTLARIGLRRLKEGQGIPAAQVDASYVRPSDAELFWKG